jgi:two-component system, NtrC family, sensor histidine kinase HydH
MSKKTLAKLFTPFFTTKAQGMGMGLAICKRFIELNGGCIDVTSEEGKGTTFAVCLPVASKQVCCIKQN